jgi:uncharacterized protein (DUF169 family)
MSQQARYKDLCERLVKGLKLETVPVAVQFSTQPPPGVPKLEGNSKACTMLDFARLEGRTFFTTADNHHCRNGSHYLGMTKPFKGLETGDWYAGKYPDKGRSMYPSPVVARRNNDYYIKIPQGTVNVISYAPLDRCPFDIQSGGIVVVILCNPKQGLYLTRSATYHRGGVVTGITGPSTCSIIMAGPFERGEMLTTLGCYGGRLYVKVKTEEEFVGFPIEMLDDIVDALERLLADRPDLNNMLGEGVGTYHIATEAEIREQIATGPGSELME